MKLIEAFNSSAPKWIKDFLSTKLSTSKSDTYANSLQDVDASTANFINVSDESVSKLRERLKGGSDLLFVLCRIPDKNITTPVMIRYDANNTDSKLKVVGPRDFKYRSFKQIIENAVEIWYTRFTEDRQNKRTARTNSRRGGIFRDRDNVVDPDFYQNVDLGALKKDASGYVYDTQRLIKKLTAIHENDFAFILNKAAAIFDYMTESYTTKLSELSANKNYYSDARGKSSISYILYAGQRVLDDSISILKSINGLVKTFDEYHSDFFGDTDYEELPEHVKNDYDHYRNLVKRELLRRVSTLSTNKDQLEDIIGNS